MTHCFVKQRTWGRHHVKPCSPFVPQPWVDKSHPWYFFPLKLLSGLCSFLLLRLLSQFRVYFLLHSSDIRCVLLLLLHLYTCRAVVKSLVLIVKILMRFDFCFPLVSIGVFWFYCFNISFVQLQNFRCFVLFIVTCSMWRGVNDIALVMSMLLWCKFCHQATQSGLRL